MLCNVGNVIKLRVHHVVSVGGLSAKTMQAQDRLLL
jgi:hypothetical protein